MYIYMYIYIYICIYMYIYVYIYIYINLYQHHSRGHTISFCHFFQIIVASTSEGPHPCREEWDAFFEEVREGRRTGKWRELNRHLKRSSKNLEIPSILGPFSDLSLGFLVYFEPLLSGGNGSRRSGNLPRRRWRQGRQGRQ